MKVPDLRNMEVTTKSGEHVCDTTQLKGEAKDGLSGTNVLKQFTTSGDAAPGKMGGEPHYGN
jgi:hypothetical protein